jgi:hypothetical protein
MNGLLGLGPDGCRCVRMSITTGLSKGMARDGRWHGTVRHERHTAPRGVSEIRNLDVALCAVLYCFYRTSTALLTRCASHFFFQERAVLSPWEAVWDPAPIGILGRRKWDRSYKSEFDCRVGVCVRVENGAPPRLVAWESNGRQYTSFLSLGEVGGLLPAAGRGELKKGRRVGLSHASNRCAVTGTVLLHAHISPYNGRRWAVSTGYRTPRPLCSEPSASLLCLAALPLAGAHLHPTRCGTGSSHAAGLITAAALSPPP